MKNNMKEPRTVDETSNPRARMAVLVLLVAIMCGMVYLYQRQQTATTLKNEPSKLPYNQNMSQADGRMRVVFDGQRSVFNVGENIELSIYADTKGQKVSGFDIVLPIPASQAKIISAESLQTGMTVKVNQLADSTYVTGVMSLENTDEATRAFLNEPIVHLVLKPFVTTALPISLIFTPGETSDSNLVLEDARDILGGVDGAVAYFGQEKLLTLGQTQKLTNDISMTMQPAVTPDPKCADCLTSVPVLVSSKGVSTLHMFEFGGFAGQQTATKEIGGGIVEATFESESTLRIRFATL